MGNRESHGKSGVHPVREKRSHEAIERELDEVVARLRDSDIDIRDYMPDMDTILREARPERRAEKLRAALELERDVTLRQSLSEIATLRAEPDPVRVEQRLQEVIARARASDVELGEYFPDLETIVREVDPVRRAKKLRNAIDNPEIDEALAEARQSLARLDRTTPNRGSVASPWAQQTPELGAPDKAALPSALMPLAPVPERTPEAEHATTLEKSPVPINPRPAWRWTVAKSVMAVIAVVAPLTMMYFLLVWRNDRGPVNPAPAATSAAIATPPLPTIPAPIPTPSAVPTIAPSVAPTDSATAPQVPTAEPHGGKPPHGGTPHAAQPSPSSEPVMPSSPKTAEPLTPPPTATASAPPPPPPSSASAPFLVRKKEP
jgi:hypothetical protein